MASTNNLRPFSHRIITPDIQAPPAEPIEAAATRYGQIADQLDAARQQLSVANAQREGAADSPGFNEGHQRNQELAADYQRGAAWVRGQQELHKNVARVLRDVASAYENYDTSAHNELSSAKTTLDRETIIARWHGDARASYTNGLAAVEAYRTYNETKHGSDYAALSGRLANLPAEGPGTTPLPSDQTGIPKPQNTRRPWDKSDVPQNGPGDKGKPSTSGSDGGTGSTPERGAGTTPRTPPDALGDTGRNAPGSTAVPMTPGPAGAMGRSPGSASPKMGSSGMPGGLGSLPSGGGGGGGLPGGLSGLGGGNPLSSLSTGAGGLSGSSPASGLPGVPGGGPSAAGLSGSGIGDPSSALARGMGAGSGVANAVSPMSSPPAMMGPATPSASPGAGGAPIAGASPAPSASPAGLAGSGAHAPAPMVPPIGGGAPGAAGGSPGTGMMMPAPGMGAPAAPGGVVPPGGSTPATIPASAAGAGGSGSAVAGGSGSAAAPTLVPATMATPVAGAAKRGPALSRDALEAGALAWELASACGVRQYPLAWAVGIFRSSTGSETVAISSEGSGYVPEGVYLPRSVRSVVADPLVDSSFRALWFGWSDPARVLVEYAALRRADDWTLVAAATTGRVDAFRSHGVEYVAANPYEGYQPAGVPTDWVPPGLDDMHVHRLALEYPDLYERLEKVAGTGSSTLQERVMFPFTQAVMSVVQQVGEYPQELREAWAVVRANREKDSPIWESYGTACRNFYMLVGAKCPGGMDDDFRPEDVPAATHQQYRVEWTAARAMEVVHGWSRAPLPLADMVYAAAAGGLDVREMLNAPLRAVEEDMD